MNTGALVRAAWLSVGLLLLGCDPKRAATGTSAPAASTEETALFAMSEDEAVKFVTEKARGNWCNAGQVLLKQALANGQYALVKALVKNDATLSFSCSPNGAPVLKDIAAEKLLSKLLKICPEIGMRVGDDGTTCVLEAVWLDDVESVKLLLEAGAPLSVPVPPVNVTPLHAAIDQNNPSIVRILLQNGANVEARTSDGLSCIDCIIIRRRDPRGGEVFQKVVNVFVEFGYGPRILPKLQ